MAGRDLRAGTCWSDGLFMAGFRAAQRVGRNQAYTLNCSPVIMPNNQPDRDPVTNVVIVLDPNGSPAFFVKHLTFYGAVYVRNEQYVFGDIKITNDHRTISWIGYLRSNPHVLMSGSVTLFAPGRYRYVEAVGSNIHNIEKVTECTGHFVSAAE